MREKLPDRRRSVTVKVRYRREHTFYLTFGYYDDGVVGDVFASGHKEGSDTQATISDACVAISRAIQNGDDLEEMLHSCATIPVVGDAEVTEEPASIIGLILTEMLKNRTLEMALEEA